MQWDEAGLGIPLSFGKNMLDESYIYIYIYCKTFFDVLIHHICIQLDLSYKLRSDLVRDFGGEEALSLAQSF